ncbi:MAG: 23S rRNA (pseudouridine(1915)-N(3))-methyltransferase RlmH [Bryobacteraceae bacterium]|nr:23S rRNA (pseudouridine(1915)-N(3))-methyltransferase RlmH [Bryobacteraceae bacterium]
MKLWLLYVGRARDAHLNALAAEYIRRSSRYMQCEMREIDPRRYDPFARHAGGRKVLLDPGGEEPDSREFARLVETAEREARDLVFVVGGHDGLPPDWKAKADRLISLSRLTMPHELARAVLAEQIYRALTMLRGHPYPR